MHQKYVLPESTWSFLPFSDETAKAAQSRAIVPARICIGNRICITLFPLNNDFFKVRFKSNALQHLTPLLFNFFVTSW